MDTRNEDVLSNVATSVIEDSIKFAWDKVKKFFKDLDAKDSIRYRTAYETYLTNTQRKNSKIKTIIYQHIPTDLYSFYECIGVEYNGNIIDTSKITNLFPIGNKIIVTGSGGVGKSILFKHLFLNSIEETPFIPVMLELRGFNNCDEKEISLYENIYKTLRDNGFELSQEYFEYSMKEGAYIILFDGYDEVNRDKTDKITKEIKALSEKYNENKFFLSSRPTSEFIGWNDFCEVEALKLSKEQALSLISKLNFDKGVKDKFYEQLKNNLFDRYESFASNPLLLNIMLLTFQKNANIPDRLNDFYEEAFVTLFYRHDATKESYQREIRCGLGCEDFKYIFSYFCFKTYFGGEYEFSEPRLRELLLIAKKKNPRIIFDIDEFLEDLTQSVCMLIKDGLTYRFSHRSFQEYFAACYTCKITDEEQKGLLSAWIKETKSKFINVDSYFKMLYDLQSDKVNRIILLPIVEPLLKDYQQFGFTLEFLKKFIYDFAFLKRKYKKKSEILIVLYDTNVYAYKGLSLINRLNGHAPFQQNKEKTKELYEKIIPVNERRDGDFIVNKVTYDQLIAVADEKEILDLFKWIEEQVLFALQLSESYESSNVLRKKKVSSILDEL